MKNAVIATIASKEVPGLSRKLSRQKLVLKKNSPHIFFGLGVAGTVVSTVLACRATLRLPETLEEIENDVSNVREGKEDPKDTAYVYLKAASKVGRLYGPALMVGTISLGSLTGAHVSLSRRNTALMAAYASVSAAFEKYRERVEVELGPDRELDIYHSKVGAKVDEKGDEVPINDPNGWSPYSRFFDEASANWQKNAELNRLFVTCQQNYANELLRARGHVFLNEVYDMLGFERTTAGSVVGWVIGDAGDNFIDFGLYEAINARFINGIERTPLLDFNVDGVIYDKI